MFLATYVIRSLISIVVVMAASLLFLVMIASELEKVCTKLC